ncbi:MAG: hypothetical protein M1837_002369 [Sclerophora amabilis]|nr:MAG: hypothetical protein M1837_002369 [Sclerophora amabilis]
MTWWLILSALLLSGASARNVVPKLQCYDIEFDCTLVSTCALEFDATQGARWYTQKFDRRKGWVHKMIVEKCSRHCTCETLQCKDKDQMVYMTEDFCVETGIAMGENECNVVSDSDVQVNWIVPSLMTPAARRECEHSCKCQRTWEVRDPNDEVIEAGERGQRNEGGGQGTRGDENNQRGQVAQEDDSTQSVQGSQRDDRAKMGIPEEDDWAPDDMSDEEWDRFLPDPDGLSQIT